LKKIKLLKFIDKQPQVVNNQVQWLNSIKYSLFFFVKATILLLTLIFYCSKVHAKVLKTEEDKLTKIVKEAREFVRVKPKHYLMLLEQNRHYLPSASDQLKFQFNHIGFWASSYIADSKQIKSYAIELARLNKTGKFDS